MSKQTKFSTALILAVMFFSIGAYAFYNGVKAQREYNELKVIMLRQHLEELETEKQLLMEKIQKQLEVERSNKKQTETVPNDTKRQEIVSKRVARVSFYTCGGNMSAQAKKMNCPNSKTATGTVPTPGVTAACHESYTGKWIEIESVGLVRCEDKFGPRVRRLNDKDRIDVLVASYSEAIAQGVQTLRYSVQ